MGMLMRRHRKDDKHAEAQKGNEQGHASETESEEEGSLEEKTVSELKDIAKEQDIDGYSNMKKSELLEALEG